MQLKKLKHGSDSKVSTENELWHPDDLWFSTSDKLIVPAVRLTSISPRAFPVARAHIWNMLPLHVTSASSMTVFTQQLKLHLFCFSVPGLSPVWLLSGPCSVCCHLGHYKFFWLIDINKKLNVEQVIRSNLQSSRQSWQCVASAAASWQRMDLLHQV